MLKPLLPGSVHVSLLYGSVFWEDKKKSNEYISSFIHGCNVQVTVLKLQRCTEQTLRISICGRERATRLRPPVKSISPHHDPTF